MNFSSFLITYSRAKKFVESLSLHCANTGTLNLPSFGNESSYLKSESKQAKLDNTVLAIDVGGTRTKVCVRTSNTSGQAWHEILDLKNEELKQTGSGKALQRMTSELGRRISLSCKSQNLSLEFSGVAVVWSNKLKCFPLQSEIKGVGAEVFDCNSGNGYRKGEWWNHDLADGDDISQFFINGLTSAEIKFNILVVGNDTIFTAKALNGCIAGVVASTGANTTIIPKGDSILYNSECGGAVEIEASLLDLHYVEAKIPQSDIRLKLEDLCAGKGLPYIFELLVQESVLAGNKELSILIELLRNTKLTAKDITSISQLEIANVFAKENLNIDINQSLASTAAELAKVVINNAGTLCAALIIISVFNQLAANKEILVALDSSQARLIPGYKKALDEFLSSWNTEQKTCIKYQLLQPDGQISVPLKGAANAIEEFL